MSRWFRYHGSKSLKPHKVDHLTRIFRAINRAESKAPRKPSLLQYYQKVYYEGRCKEIVDRRFPKLVQEAAQKGHPVPRRVSVQNKVSEEMLNAESAAFKAELAEQLMADYREAKAHWEASLPNNVGSQFSAEDYAR